MTAVHRMHVLEQMAANILLNNGYEPLIVSNTRSSRYSAFNLMAGKEQDDGTVDVVMVKLKISLHPFISMAEAAVFCRDEIRCAKKFFDKVPAETDPSRFEVWFSIPSHKFQTFEITRNGIQEILLPEEMARQQGCAA
ncbi:MAG: hypothetical protein Q7U51_07470 [Methanoregula sp.]|nr:hypothetical protein [Methanoregula sp.]